MAEPTPAPAWTRTSWPRLVSSCTPEGVIATRNSLFLTSLGTPTFTCHSWARNRRRSRLGPPAVALLRWSEHRRGAPAGWARHEGAGSRLRSPHGRRDGRGQPLGESDEPRTQVLLPGVLGGGTRLDGALSWASAG